MQIKTIQNIYWSVKRLPQIPYKSLQTIDETEFNRKFDDLLQVQQLITSQIINHKKHWKHEKWRETIQYEVTGNET